MRKTHSPVPVRIVVALVLAAAALVPPAAAGATIPPVRVSARLPHPVAEQVTGAVGTTRVFHLAQAADQVAVYWRGHRRAQVQVAFSADGDQFGRPMAAGRDDLGRQRRDGTTYGLLRSADGAVAVRVIADRPIPELTLLGLTDSSGRSAVTSSSASSTRTTPPTATGTSMVSPTAQPPVISRAAWGADPSLMTWAPQFYPTKKLVVHHTDTANDYTDKAGAQAQIRSIYYYHSVTQGWGDIGYNFLIDKFGTIYEGRYSREYAGVSPSGDDVVGNGVTGAHTGGWNSGTVGIALLGTFSNQDVTPAARLALEDLLAWEASRNGLDPQATEQFVNPVSGATITTPNIAGHRDYAATLCPGDTFYATLPRIRTDVAARISGSPPPADTTAPSAPATLTAAAGRSRVTLSWTASSDDTGVAGYQIWRSRSSGSGYVQVGTGTGTSYVDGSLARRTTYYYKVRSYDAAGNNSPFSPVAAAKTT